MPGARGSRTTRSMPRATGVPTGSPGGIGATATAKAGASHARLAGMTSPTMYLWVLVGIEVMLMSWLRHSFRRHHGG